MAKYINPAKVVTGVCRFSYANLWEAKAMDENSYNQETQWNGCFQGKQTPVQDLDNFKTKKCQGKTCIGGEIKRRD